MRCAVYESSRIEERLARCLVRLQSNQTKWLKFEPSENRIEHFSIEHRVIFEHYLFIFHIKIFNNKEV